MPVDIEEERPDPTEAHYIDRKTMYFDKKAVALILAACRHIERRGEGSLDVRLAKNKGNGVVAIIVQYGWRRAMLSPDLARIIAEGLARIPLETPQALADSLKRFADEAKDIEGTIH